MDYLIVLGLAPLTATLMLLLTMPSKRKLAAALTWVQQAQLYYAPRMQSQLGLLAAPALACVIAHSYKMPSAIWWLTATLAAVWAILLRWQLQRRVQDAQLPLGDFLRSLALFTVLMGGFFGLLSIFFAVLMPWEFNRQTLLVGTCWLASLLFLRSNVMLGMLRSLGWIRAPSERLQRIIDKAAERMALRPKQVFEAPSFVANAFALPTIQGVIFTTATLKALDDQQAETVAAHEICHLSMSKLQLALRTASVVILNTLMLLAKPIIGQFGGPSYLLIAIVAFIFMVLVMGRLSRSEEERADAAAASHLGEDEVYARALEQIHSVNLIPADLKSSAGHPPLYDRMLSAGVTPDYERPGKPPLWRFRIALFLQTLLAIYFLISS